jgi:hypothetical protein
MPLYLVQAERVSVRQIEVEAESALEAREKVSSMSAYQLESEPEDDHHWQFDWNAQRVDEDLNPIDEPLEHPLRVGADEIAAAWNEMFFIPEFVQ